jgi:hypothetical protein
MTTLLLLPSTAAPDPHRYLAGNAHAQPIATVRSALRRHNEDHPASYHLPFAADPTDSTLAPLDRPPPDPNGAATFGPSRDVPGYASSSGCPGSGHPRQTADIATPAQLNPLSSPFASCRSAVSKPSVNQP